MSNCNGDCNQGRRCDCGTPYRPSPLDAVILAVALVFVASCIGYLWGGL